MRKNKKEIQELTQLEYSVKHRLCRLDEALRATGTLREYGFNFTEQQYKHLSTIVFVEMMEMNDMKRLKRKSAPLTEFDSINAVSLRILFNLLDLQMSFNKKSR